MGEDTFKLEVPAAASVELPELSNTNNKDNNNKETPAPSDDTGDVDEVPMTAPPVQSRWGDEGCTKKGILIISGVPHLCFIKDRVFCCFAPQHQDDCKRAIFLDGSTVEIGATVATTALGAVSSAFKRLSGRSAPVRPEDSADFTIIKQGWGTVYTASSITERDAWVASIKKSQDSAKKFNFRVSGILSLEIVEGKHLAVKDAGRPTMTGWKEGKSDPFAIAFLEQQQEQTPIIFECLDPVWNSKFSFFVQRQDSILVVQVYDYDFGTRNDFMGQVLIPVSSLPDNEQIDMWFPVLPSKNDDVKGLIHLRIKYHFSKDLAAEVNPIYGAPLQELMEAGVPCASNGVPSFFLDGLQYLEQNAMDEEGLFRISGNHTEINTIKHNINKGTGVNFFQDAKYKDNPHLVAALLKAYLRELPEPVFTFDNFTAIVALADENEKHKIEGLRKIIDKLPTAHQGMLQVLLPFLSRLSKNSAKNKMGSQNLAIVFSQSLIQPKTQSIDTMLDTVNLTAITSFMIDNYDKILH